MDAAEIVVHGVQGNAVRMVLDLLGERIGKAGKAAHGHAHGKIVPLDITGRDVIGVGTPFDDLLVDARAFCRGVFLGMTFLSDVVTKGLDEHTVVYIPAKCILDGIEVGSEPICGQLYPIVETRTEVVHELNSDFRGTVTETPCRDKLGIGTDSRPCPDVIGFRRGLLGRCDVLVLTIDE